MGKIIGIMDDCFDSPNMEDKEQKEIDMNEIQDEVNNIENNEADNDIED